MSSANLHIADRDRMAAIVAAVAQYAPHQVPIYRAAYQGLIGVVQPNRDGIISCARFRHMGGRPWLILLGDDDGVCTGPDGWACAKRVLGWARQVIIHGAAGHAEDYAWLPPATMVVRRLVLIECASRDIEAWHAAAGRWALRAAVQRVVPSEGVHPVPLDRSKMQ